MRKVLVKSLLFSVCILVFGCKSSKVVTQIPANTSNNAIPLSFGDKRKLDVTFTDAVIQKEQGNYPEAIDRFKKCLDIYPNHAASMYEIAFIYNGGGKSDLALPYIQKAVSLDRSNQWYRLLLGKCYMETEKFSDAAQTYETLVKSKSEKLDNYYLWADALLHAGKPKEAIDVYNKIEGMIGVSQEISVQKQRIYLSLRQFDKAVAEAQKLIKSDPNETDYQNMLAELYFQNKMPDKAIEICNNILKTTPDEPNTHLMLAQYYEGISDDKSAFSHVKIAFENPNLDIDTKVKILIGYFDLPDKFQEEKEESRQLIDILLKVHPNDAKSYSIQGDFLNKDGKTEQARDAFRKAMELDKTKYPIWQQVMALDETLNDYNSLESDSKQAIELFPSEPYTYIFNASANYQLKNYKQAIDVANEGKDYVVGDKKLLAQFYSMLGDCYNSLKEYSMSDEKFEKSVNLDPENANIMNNWAYYMSLRNDRLDKAEKMSLKSNELAKDNASYEDTYAWILYKQKKYDEAKRWQERALEHAGDTKSGTLLEHYGDILYQLGQPDRAFEYWQKAKEAGKYSDLLDKKLLDKKLYE